MNDDSDDPEAVDNDGDNEAVSEANDEADEEGRRSRIEWFEVDGAACGMEFLSRNEVRQLSPYSRDVVKISPRTQGVRTEPGKLVCKSEAAV